MKIIKVGSEIKIWCECSYIPAIVTRVNRKSVAVESAHLLSGKGTFPFRNIGEELSVQFCSGDDGSFSVVDVNGKEVFAQKPNISFAL